MNFLIGVVAGIAAFCALIFVSAFFGFVGPYELITFLAIAVIVGVLVTRRRMNTEVPQK